MGTASREWVESNRAPWKARSCHGAVTLRDGSVLVIGGRDEQDAAFADAFGDGTRGHLGYSFNDIWCFRPETCIWTKVAKGLWNMRMHSTVVVLDNGEVLTAGGFGERGVVNDVWRLRLPSFPPAKTSTSSKNPAVVPLLDI